MIGGERFGERAQRASPLCGFYSPAAHVAATLSGHTPPNTPTRELDSYLLLFFLIESIIQRPNHPEKMPVSLSSVMFLLPLLACHQVLLALDLQDVLEKQGVKKRLSLQSTGEQKRQDILLG